MIRKLVATRVAMGEGTGLGTGQDCLDAFTFLDHVPICAADSANVQVVEHLYCTRLSPVHNLSYDRLQEIKKDAKVKHQETQAEEEQATISLC
jgi:hypothetical protein